MKADTRKKLWRVGLMLGVPLLFMVFVFLALAGYDLLRPGNTPFLKMDLNERIAPSIKGIHALQTNTKALDKASVEKGFMEFADRITSETKAMNPTDALRPEKVYTTAEARDKTRKMNMEYIRIYQSIGDYYRSRQWEDLAVAKVRLYTEMDAVRALEKKIVDVNNMKSANNDFFAMENSYMEEKTFLKFVDAEFERYYQLTATIDTAWMMTLIYHGKWSSAVEFVRGVNEAYAWEMEIFLYRQMGAAGRGLIAQRSTQRNWKALKRSVMSIGPDFEWPHREQWD